ncbi:MAG TPA: bifunctional aspartate kinase/homoserine dehydrogenase I [Bacteroidales bacterium]|nr:bifunctional aspartate kinase/homoserine dehydrogenase I [Bacteroidales bacterium]
MQVLKFGGSSVADAANISNVTKIVKENLKRDRTILVASAIGGCTDKLIEIGKLAAMQDETFKTLIDELENRHLQIILELFPVDFQKSISIIVREIFHQLRDVCKGVYYLKELSNSSLDLIMSFGEILSTKIISERFTSMGINNLWADARELIKTEPCNNGNSVIKLVSYANIRKMTNSSRLRLIIVPGFIASDTLNHTTTLGRGGSDFTAALVAEAVEARELQIWSDVNGMMTADPRIVPEAITIRHISYKEAQELSHFGAKVIYPPTIQPAISKGIPIVVKNTFSPDDPGTVIEKNPPESRGKIRGISRSNKIALLSMEGSGMVGVPGYSARLFGALANAGINIILITQASSVHTMCVAIEDSDAAKAKKTVDETFAYEISLNKVNPLKVENGFSIISLVGDDLKNQSGTGGRMFNALGRAGINIRAIAQGSSEKNISVVVKEEESDISIKVIHDEFFGVEKKRINLFIAGYGNVAKSLLSIIKSRREWLIEKRHLEIHVVAICNSRHMILNKSGIEIDSIDESLKKGDPSDIYRFRELCSDMNLPDSIFVDCTADRGVSSLYQDFMQGKCSVVTCNKIGLSSSQESYDALQETCCATEVKLKYETTVGAALPVISTIKSRVECGDNIRRIEAILSGTLNYLFSKYDGSAKFVDIVREAKNAGYTEPDPRIDLSGTDVLRKTVILARESGFRLEPEEIDVVPIFNSDLFSYDSEEFMTKIEECEDQMLSLYKSALSRGERLRYIATIENGNYKIGVQSVSSDHPFYNINGRDNAIMIFTDEYSSPLTVSGAGAGARLTASGLFADLLA